MSILKKAKGHLFPLVVAAGYLGLFVVRADLGIASVKNSAYYIKEMILIMPVIFVLTALLDTWVPKEQIMRFLGREAGIKGIVFSLALGSLSAGPIYAAFPLCVMLHQKGASVRNLVIILSAWAVIKVPMLLNELKFLGFAFMAVRWVLTVVAIIVFSWITAKIVKSDDLPAEAPQRRQAVSVNQSACMGCGACVRAYPDMFAMDGKKAVVRNVDLVDPERLKRAARACPVQAVVLPDEPD